MRANSPVSASSPDITVLYSGFFVPVHAWYHMTTTARLAEFVQDVSYEELDADVIDALKRRILDAIGVGIGAIGHAPVEAVRKTVGDTSTQGECTLWGYDASASPDQAAMMNTTLTRFLDFMDSYLAPGETPHPMDNIATAVVCGEYVDASGTELIEGVAVAYEVQHKLAYNAAVRDRGWDHVTHTIFSATAAAAKMLGLDEEETRNALGIAGTSHNALRVTRTGEIGMWKGLAAANTARNAVYSAMLAKNGVEGPTDVFEGEKGWKHIVAGDFECRFDRSCASVHDVMAKKYVAETYAQSAVEGLLELIDEHDIDASAIDSIHLETFAGAKQIIGGGEGGDRHTVHSREQADHSLPYMLAVAALDGTLMEGQYSEARIEQQDVQSLLQQVTVEASDAMTERFEDGEMPARLVVETEDDRYTIEKTGFAGHPTDPMDWEQLEAKFEEIVDGYFSREGREGIIERVKGLENHDVADIVELIE